MLPGYVLNLAAVFLLNTVFHFTAIGIISTVLVGDVIAYVGGVALTPHILRYMKWIGYYDKDDLLLPETLKTKPEPTPETVQGSTQ